MFRSLPHLDVGILRQNIMFEKKQTTQAASTVVPHVERWVPKKICGGQSPGHKHCQSASSHQCSIVYCFLVKSTSSTSKGEHETSGLSNTFCLIICFCLNPKACRCIQHQGPSNPWHKCEPDTTIHFQNSVIQKDSKISVASTPESSGQKFAPRLAATSFRPYRYIHIYT